MSKTTRKPYDGSKAPSLQMVETLTTVKAAKTQLNKIELRGMYSVGRHEELSKLAAATGDPKELRKYRNEDVALVEELEILKKAKEATARRLEELKALEEVAEDYKYTTIEW